jgi:acyl-homoserine-lactone acylase
MTMRLATSVALGALMGGVLAACTGAPEREAGAAGGEAAGMSAEIRRTAYGVPHIKASDHAGLGYGVGYAAAEDNVCEIAERMATVNGERAKHFGRGENDANLRSDLYHKRLIASGEMERLLDGPAGSVDPPSPEARALARGYAAGVARYVRDIAATGGAANITDPRCKGAAWVREMTEMDYWRHTFAGQVLVQAAGVAGAAPPGLGDQASIADDPLVDPAGETTQLGSNA